MNLGSKAVLSLVLLCHVTGLLLFCKGFLLKRIVVPEYSKCGEHEKNHFNPDSCNNHPRVFKRVVWVLIDALRFDFMLYDDSLDPNPPPHRNRMTFTRDLLRNKPQNAKLFKLLVDPPTTTMQRLKALTTGGLPTFVDIGSNFNSYEITEDSLIWQCHQNNRKITFIGDDTWLGLYPSLIDKVFPFPSLNVKDLDTVDDGVRAHLVPEVTKKESDFVIGHMLGVDHCGHTHSPSHSCMVRKLREADEMLKSLFPVIDNDTIVFVFGDHGMTPTGDHGGETDLETEAALLVYTPLPLFEPKSSVRPVYQTDLVPTVSLILGTPIPFSNLGIIIPEILLSFINNSESSQNIHKQPNVSPYSGQVTSEFLSAVLHNAKQVHAYLVAYAKHASDFEQSLLDKLKEQLKTAELLHSRALDDLRKGGGETDHQLSLTSAADAYYLFLAEARSMCQRVWAQFDNVFIHLGLTVVAAVPISLFLFFVTRILRFASRSGGPYRLLWTHLSGDAGWIDMISIVLAICSCLVPVSNNLVVFEQDVVMFLLQTQLLCLLVARVRMACRQLPHQYKRMSLVPLVFKVSWQAIAAMLCVWLSRSFYFCRDQQDYCEQTSLVFSLSLAYETTGWLAVVRYLLVCTIFIYTAVLVVDHFLNNLDSVGSRYKGIVKCAVSLSSVCVCLYWGFLGLPLAVTAVLPSWVHTLLPRLVYAASVCVVVMAVCWKPGHLLHHSQLPTASLGVVLVSVWVPLCMLLNDGVCLSACLFMAQLFLILKSLDKLPHVSLFSRSVLWSLMSMQYFYAFGHQATVTSLRIEAGFVGLHGDVTSFTLPLAGLLVGLNLMASHVLIVLALPLFLRSSMASINNLFLLQLFCILIGSLKLFVATLTASILRRHLMIWAVFGPRFLYEASFQCLIDLLTLFVFTLLVRHSSSTSTIVLDWHKKQ